MDEQSLKNNQLYKQIECKNVFKTFSKSYRCSRNNKHKYNSSLIPNNLSMKSALTHNTYAHLTQTINIANLLQGQAKQIDSQVYPSYLDRAEKQAKTGSLQRHSSTLPLRENSDRYQYSTIYSSNRISQIALLKLNSLRKSKQFKIKSCQGKVRLNYQAPVDQSEFSTIDLRKKLSGQNNNNNVKKMSLNLLRHRKDEKTMNDIRKSALVLSRLTQSNQRDVIIKRR